MISGGRTEQLDIFCRVTGFTSDFLSFIDVELIRFFHGALQFMTFVFSQSQLTRNNYDHGNIFPIPSMENPNRTKPLSSKNPNQTQNFDSVPSLPQTQLYTAATLCQTCCYLPSYIVSVSWFKDFKAPVLFSSSFRALSLGEKVSSTFKDTWEHWVSPPFGRYQIILKGDRGTSVRATCP